MFVFFWGEGRGENRGLILRQRKSELAVEDFRFCKRDEDDIIFEFHGFFNLVSSKL